MEPSRHLVMRSQSTKTITSELKTQAIILFSIVGAFWLVELIDQFLFWGRLNLYGIVPRTTQGLWGILFAPFLHGDWQHLIANTIPFITLGWFVMLQNTSDFFVVSAITMLVGGFGVWLFGVPGSVHIGASILIFGYLGFLLLRGLFQRNLPSIMLSIIVVCLYGSLVWGILPIQKGISWEGHLFGLLGGVLAAYLIGQRHSS